MTKDNSRTNVSEQIARSIFQQAITQLLQWAGAEVPNHSQDFEHSAIKQVQQLLNWHTAEIGVLNLLFDHITLARGSSKTHFVPLHIIEDDKPAIPYPRLTPPTEEQIKTFKQAVRQDLSPQVQLHWHNLSWLAIALEKYGSCVSYGDSTVALIDLVRITTAIATAISNHNNQICLVAGDLSGIQKFIYTIASSGALKSLRARSFYLELVTEEVVQQLLAMLNLPRSSVIYAGGGNLYLLAPSGIEAQISEKAEEINQWLY